VTTVKDFGRKRPDWTYFAVIGNLTATVVEVEGGFVMHQFLQRQCTGSTAKPVFFLRVSHASPHRTQKRMQRPACRRIPPLTAVLLLTCAFACTVAATSRDCLPLRTRRHSRPRSRRHVTLGEQLHHIASDDAAWCALLTQATTEYANNESAQLWAEIADVLRYGTAAEDPHQNVLDWMSHRCDPSLWRRLTELAPLPSCTASATPSAVHAPACVGLKTCVRGFARNASHTPHIAIILGTTSRKVASPSTANMALFTVSLPSIAKTVECGFRYTVYLGHDSGDPFFDAPAGVQALAAWFEEHVRLPLRQGGIDVALAPVRVDNPSSKPGPVFNAVAQHARKAGADFFFRINDDTMMMTPWAGAFACALCSLGPPYGVIGPAEIPGPFPHEGLLIHDFVHPMHLDIFPDYYPPALTDWWLDDWMSKVYGPRRSYQLATVKVCVALMRFPSPLFPARK
jgi:hypothetical protein